MTLYELTGQYAELLDMAVNGDIDEQTFQDTLEAMDFAAEIEDKAEGYAKVITMLQGDVKQCREEKKRIAENRKTMENKIQRMKDRLQEAMEYTGHTKIKTPLFSLSVQNNPPGVSIPDESAVPEAYRIPQPAKVDKKKILDDLRAGAAFDWAAMTQGRSLRIR